MSVCGARFRALWLAALGCAGAAASPAAWAAQFPDGAAAFAANCAVCH